MALQRVLEPFPWAVTSDDRPAPIGQSPKTTGQSDHFASDFSYLCPEEASKRSDPVCRPRLRRMPPPESSWIDVCSAGSLCMQYLASECVYTGEAILKTV